MNITNWNEMLEDECFDQSCKFGNRTDGSVYCHSKDPKSPRKCRQSWYWGNEKGKLDEDCVFFEKNTIIPLQSQK